MQPTTVSAPVRENRDHTCDALGVAELLARTGLEPDLGRRWDHDPAAVLAEHGLAGAHAAVRLPAGPASAARISTADTPGPDAATAYTFCINSAQDSGW
jgi:hypothetical protein